MRLVLACAALLALLAPAVSAQIFNPKVRTLANGMEIIVVENFRAPVIGHMVWYRCGSADEEPGKSGLAHFLEHLMFKGTDEVQPGQFNRILARNGGRDNAFTSYDYTAYFQIIAADRLDLVMRLEADRMNDLILTDAVVYPERDVVLEERRQTLESQPIRRLYEALAPSLYVDHPYGRPIIGWRAEIADLTRADAEAWYRRWYAPNNAVLVVSGAVHADEVFALAERHFGALPAEPLPPRPLGVLPPLRAERRIVVRDDQVRQPHLTLAWIAPGYFSPTGTEHVDPLEVAARAIGSGPTSILYRRLVIERQVATSASVSYSPDSRGPGALYVSVSPAPGRSAREAEAATREELGRLVAEGVPDQDVADARRRMRYDAIYARDSVLGPAYALGAARAIGLTIEQVESWPARIAAVTTPQVDAALRAVIGDTPPVTGLLLPEGMGEDEPTTAVDAPVAAGPATQTTR